MLFFFLLIKLIKYNNLIIFKNSYKYLLKHLIKKVLNK